MCGVWLVSALFAYVPPKSMQGLYGLSSVLRVYYSDLFFFSFYSLWLLSEVKYNLEKSQILKEKCLVQVNPYPQSPHSPRPTKTCYTKQILKRSSWIKLLESVCHCCLYHAPLLTLDRIFNIWYMQGLHWCRWYKIVIPRHSEEETQNTDSHNTIKVKQPSLSFSTRWLLN